MFKTMAVPSSATRISETLISEKLHSPSNILIWNYLSFCQKISSGQDHSHLFSSENIFRIFLPRISGLIPLQKKKKEMYKKTDIYCLVWRNVTSKIWNCCIPTGPNSCNKNPASTYYYVSVKVPYLNAFKCNLNFWTFQWFKMHLNCHRPSFHAI